MAVKKRSSAQSRSQSTRRFCSCEINLNSYDIVIVCSSKNRQTVKQLAGTHGPAPSRGDPVLFVNLVDDANDYEEGGRYHTPELLLGEGFALSYAQKTMYWPRRAPRVMHMKNLGDQNPFVRTVIFSIALLAEHNGLETVARAPSNLQAPLYLHASAVLTPKGALVFCGECTFGKTTISTKLLKDFPLLEDDQVTILVSPPGTAPARKRHPRVIVFGDARKNSKPLKITTAPLAGIFWLKKDPENTFEKMDQAEAAAQMLNPMVNWKNPVAIKQRLRLFKALFETVPCRRLAFKKESAALVEFLKAEGYI
ncbi:MAG TPA: hypothetical protein VKX17_22330 [Planctomycetota bacterium]|nr:hypothetical protein [Planctomycetota bacterium]